MASEYAPSSSLDAGLALEPALRRPGLDRPRALCLAGPIPRPALHAAGRAPGNAASAGPAQSARPRNLTPLIGGNAGDPAPRQVPARRVLGQNLGTAACLRDRTLPANRAKPRPAAELTDPGSRKPAAAGAFTLIAGTKRGGLPGSPAAADRPEPPSHHRYMQSWAL